MRFPIKDFVLANPLYRSATVTFYTVVNGVKTSTLATLYDGIVGTGTLPNPHVLDSRGKFRQPVYVEQSVVGTISGISVPTHDTGVIFGNNDLITTLQNGIALLNQFLAAGVVDLLWFLQDGVGAVLRLANGKMRERVSLEDFGGAAGAGDNTAAFQLAATYLGNYGTIDLGAGTYLSNWATGTARINLKGKGMDKTILGPYDITKPAIQLGGDTGWRNGKLSQLTVRGNNTGARTGTVVQFGHTVYEASDELYGRWFFENVRFADAETAVLKLYGNIGNWFRGCQFDNTEFHIKANNHASMHAGNMVFRDCHFQFAYKAVCFVNSSIASYQLVFDNCIIEANPGCVLLIPNFNVVGGDVPIVMKDCISEGNATGGNIVIGGVANWPSGYNDLPQFAYLRNTRAQFTRMATQRMTLINTQVTTDQVMADNMAVTKDVDSSIVNNDLVADVASAASGYSRTVRYNSRQGQQSGANIIPHRIGLSFHQAARIGGYPKILAQELFQEPAGVLFVKQSGAGVDFSSGVTYDGVLNRVCQQVSLAAAVSTAWDYYGPGATGFPDVTNGEYVAWFLSVRRVSGTLPSFYIGLNKVFGAFAGPTDTAWHTFGGITIATAGSGSIGVGINSGVGPLTGVFNLGEFSLVTFDNIQAAIEYLDSRTMAVTGHGYNSNTGGGVATQFWAGFLSPAAGTAGNNTTPSNGARWWAEVDILHPCTLTGIQYLVGGTGGTDSVIVELHAIDGSLLATSALAGTLVGTANELQAVPFTYPFSVIGPGRYFIALQFNGNTARFQSHTLPGNKLITGTAAGTFGLSAAITPGSTFAPNKGPIASTY